MGRCSGRAWAHAAFALLIALNIFAGGPNTALGQDGEEVIADPELSGPKKPTAGHDANGDETIADPELSGGPGGGGDWGGGGGSTHDYGWGSVYTPKTESQSDAPPAPEEEEYDPLANTGIGKLDVVGQQVFDLRKDDNLEDFYETRLRFGGEVDFRMSRSLRISIGTRVDFLWAAPHQNDPALRVYKLDENGDPKKQPPDSPLNQDRYEIDIIPLSAYADWTAGEGVHLRLGAQTVSLGRMDGFSVIDILAVLDLRPGPRADPSSLKLAQPALRLDWDLSSWATLQAVYVPWFMPHLSRPNRDAYLQSGLSGSGLQQLSAQSSELLDPSYQTRATEVAMRLVAPPPDFRSPQAEARLNFRGSSFELALLGGTALEKLPSIYYAPLVDQLLRGADGDGTAATSDELNAFATQVFVVAAEGRPLVDVEYHRYYLVGFDGSFDVAPIQIGFEFGYSPERHLYAASKKGTNLPLPNVEKQICNPMTMGNPPPCPQDFDGNVTDRSLRRGVPTVMGALHMEWLKGETFMLAGEGYLVQALELPFDKTRDWLGTLPGTGMFVGGLLTAAYQIGEGRWRFDLTTLLTPGPSAMVAPHVEVKVADGFYLNLGAQFYEGPEPSIDRGPPPFVKPPGFAARNITFGGLYDGYDNVYVGFRWLP